LLITVQKLQRYFIVVFNKPALLNNTIRSWQTSSDSLLLYLTQLHWLNISGSSWPSLMFRYLRSTALSYLADDFHQSSMLRDLHICSASSSLLVFWCTHHSTASDRAIPVTVSRLWNSTLPQNIMSAPSPTVFWKTSEYPSLQSFLSQSPVVLAHWLCHFGHYNRSFYFLLYLLHHSVSEVKTLRPFKFSIIFGHRTYVFRMTQLLREFACKWIVERIVVLAVVCRSLCGHLKMLYLSQTITQYFSV